MSEAKQIRSAKEWLMRNGYSVWLTTRNKWLVVDQSKVETKFKSDSEFIAFAKEKGCKETK